MQDVLKRHGGSVLAISTDPPQRIQEGLAENPGLPAQFASAQGAAALQTLKLVHEGVAKKAKMLAIPANILIDAQDVVRWTHYAQVVMDRPDPAEVLMQVNALGLK